MQRYKNVFNGPDSIKDYLNPGKMAYLPLVELPLELNPFRDKGVRLFAKMMTFNPVHNVKAVPAYNMILEKHNRGELQGVTDVIENSSGNTVSALAVSARQFGIENIHAFVPTEVSYHKVMMLLFFGISPIVNQEPDEPDPTDPRSGIYKAKAIGEERDNWINPGQYSNPDNPGGHEKWIGEQIWEQTEGKITVFCASLGTTGTIQGNSRYLKSKNKDVTIVGVRRAPNNYVPGPRTEVLLRLIGFDWEGHVDEIQDAETRISYQKSMELSRRGIFAGPSSGLIYVGLIQYLQEKIDNGKLDALRNEDGEIVCTFICCDTPFPYLDEYFKYVDKSYFPPVENEDLMQNKL